MSEFFYNNYINPDLKLAADNFNDIKKIQIWYLKNKN